MDEIQEDDERNVPDEIRKVYASIGRIVKTEGDLKWHREDMNGAEERRVRLIVQKLQK